MLKEKLVSKKRKTSKVFKIITNNHSSFQSQQQTWATDIQEEDGRISTILPYAKGTCDKLQRLLKTHKIRSNFHTENTLCKRFCKPKDRRDTEDKSKIIYEIECNNFEAVYFDKSKCSLKLRSDEQKRTVKNYDSGKKEIAETLLGRGSQLELTEIKKKVLHTIYSLNNPEHINKNSCMLRKIWHPNLQ